MKLYENLDIENLILKCRERDEEAFCELVKRYTPMMHKLASEFSASGADSEELISEGCIALHSAALSYDLTQHSVTFGLYARVCAYHRMVDLVRHRRESLRVVSDIEEDIPDGGSTESDIVTRETFGMLINGARNMLSAYEYRVLILHIQGYKTAEIAKLLERNAKSVDNAKSRIFRRLRAAFSDLSDN